MNGMMNGQQMQYSVQQPVGQNGYQQQMQPALVPMMSDPNSLNNQQVHQIHQLQHAKTPHELHLLQHNPSYAPNANAAAVARQRNERISKVSNLASMSSIA